MKPTPRNRISLRVNGTRIGGAARPGDSNGPVEPLAAIDATHIRTTIGPPDALVIPTATAAPITTIDPLASIASTRMPVKRLLPRVGAALSTRPNEYMPDDDEAVS